MDIIFKKLIKPDQKVAKIIEIWSNDPQLVHLIRPNRNQEDLEAQFSVTVDSLKKQMNAHPIYLIYIDGRLVGEMNFQIDPAHLYKKETCTAWIGIVIGKESARGKGVGTQALVYLEQQIRDQNFKRIELGVFEFNTQAINLYKKSSYLEIGRIDDFTYWQGKMWQDIRMEKHL